MKQTIITIGGLPGSGKSTIADQVAEKLDWKRFSSGDFMREIASERDVTLDELSRQAEIDPQIDKMIDARNKDLADAEKIVIDSRLAFHFIPGSFSVYLAVDLDEAARRIYDDEKDTRTEAGEDHDSLEETKQHMKQRIESEKTRYEDLYDLDHTDTTHYDLVIDTTDKDISEITRLVISEYKDWQGN